MASSVENMKDVLAFKTKLLLKIQEDFRCTECKSLPRPGFFPMFICQQCPTMTRKCKPCNFKGWELCQNPKCQGYSAGYNPSTLIEDGLSQKLFEELPLQCENGTSGCKVILMESELLEHETKCVYTKIPCVESLCLTLDLAINRKIP